MVPQNRDAYLKGVSGENKVAKILSKLNKEEYIVINNVLLKRPYAKEGDVPTVQIDHIVVSVYGIFTVETKNYSGKIYGYDNAKKWQFYMGGKRYDFENPLLQNHGHSKTIQIILSYKSTALGLSNTCFDIYQIIAFSDRADLSKLKANRENVGYFSDILNIIKNKSTIKCLDFTQIKRIAEYINELNIYSPEAFEEHVSDIKRLKGEESTEKNWNLTVGDKKYARYDIEESKISKSDDVSKASENIITKENTKDKREDDVSRKPILAISIVFIVFGIITITCFFFCCGGTFLTNVFKDMVNSSYINPSVPSNNPPSFENNLENETDNEVITVEEFEIDTPQEKNITVQEKIYQPRKDAVNDIIYICHGSYNVLNPPYVDEDGIEHKGLINMWCHYAFTDGVYIDINAKSYNELSFDYFASTTNWNNNVVTVQVYDLDTDKMIYESDCFEQGHTNNASVDVSNCDNIRLKMVEANDGICYCCIDNIILKK